MLSTTNAPAIVGPAQTGSLVLGPVAATAVAFADAVSTVVYITADTNAYRVPRVTRDPVASWVREGEEIAPSDASLDELTIVSSKVAGLSIITRELANDSNPAAAETVGAGLARDIARRVDEAFCGALSAPAPSGLAALAGTTDVGARTAWSDLDAFAEGISAAQTEGATPVRVLGQPRRRPRPGPPAPGQRQRRPAARRRRHRADPAQPARRSFDRRPRPGPRDHLRRRLQPTADHRPRGRGRHL